jgi:MFS family permease
MPAPAAIAIVTSVGYLGSFLGPPLVGAVAEIVNLAVALTLIALAGLTAILLARWLPERPTSDTSVARTH